MKLFVLLILAVFASEKREDAENGPKYGENREEKSIVVKIEEDESVKVNKKSKYFGLSYHKTYSKWYAQRYSKNEKNVAYNGYYDDEETAAHASDTLARKLMKNGEQDHKLNFPDDHTEVYPEEKKGTSKFIGVSYHRTYSKWYAQRRSKNEKKKVSNGCYDDEKIAAHASDTLARKLMKNGEQGHKLNFPDDHTDVYREEKKSTSKYIGVIYDKKDSKWRAQRQIERKKLSNGYYDDEETAAHASDTLARKFLKNGEQKRKLNFPDDHTEVYSEKFANQDKRKRQKDLSLEYPQNK